MFFWSLVYLFIATTVVGIKGNTPFGDFVLERIIAFFTFRGIAPMWFFAALFLAIIMFVTIIFKSRILHRCMHTQILFHFLFLITNIVLFGILQDWYSCVKTTMSIYFLYPIITILRLIPSIFYLDVGFILGYFWLRILKSKLLVRYFYSIFFILTFIILKISKPCGMNFHTNDFYNNVHFSLFAGIIGSVSIILISCIFSRKFNILSKLGERSIDIMVLHIPILRAIGHLFSVIGLANYFISMTITALFISFCISKYFLDKLRLKYNFI